MSAPTRLKLAIRGAVQGVGFRPFVYRLATGLNLRGWVNNSAQGVFIEVEGAYSELEQFLLRLEREKPPHSFIQSLEASWLDALGYSSFEIRPSEATGAKAAIVLPDIATCSDCLSDILNPTNRRYLYPFTNCTNCGPRFSIIERLPYDRANTSMKQFTMCALCRAEYDDPRNRRFHAQPNACPECGPHLELWATDGRMIAGADRAALSAAADAIRQGKIVALKGLGGFHLIVEAANEDSVKRLRERKHREEKPFAVMFPTVSAIKAWCEVSALEERLLRSSEAPIVLLRRRDPTDAAPFPPAIAPGNPYCGAMLPYTPLHHLLLTDLQFPVVATSGNLSDEPICIDEHEVRDRLGAIADLFLVHNRPIVRHVDDSVARVLLGREQVLRRARGYAPLPVRLAERTVPAGKTLAVGAHLKNAVALQVDRQVFISQHIGDLETDQALEAFRRVIVDLENLYEAQPSVIAADAHPDYLSTRFAREAVEAESPTRTSLIQVQHHLAHVLACMAENELRPPVLGVSWDGTGYGADGTVWGGEFFIVSESSSERVAHFRQFRLAGGEKAIKEPRRTALGLLYALLGEAAFSRHDLAPIRAFTKTELQSLRTMLAKGLNSPLTSSLGRLFDAVAALIGLNEVVHFEGQAAMALEFALSRSRSSVHYDFPIIANPIIVLRPRSRPRPRISKEILAFEDEDENEGRGRTSRNALSQQALVIDWAPAIQALLADLKRGIGVAELSARFHNGLVESIVALARRLDQRSVVLTGGCFQNRYLTEGAVTRLQEEGFSPYWHQRVPPNDGGICLGQIVAALRRIV